MKPAAMKVFALAAAAICVAATAVAQTASTPPAALTQAVAATQAAKADYAFDLEMRSSKQNWRARFDPAASPSLRLTEPNRDALEDDARRNFDRMAESAEGVSWCAGENLTSAQNIRLLREDETSATYAFQPSADMMRQRGGQGGRGGSQGGAFANRMQGEFTITKQNPDITQLRIFAQESFSPIPFVRLERINIMMRCARAPNGRRYAAETAMEFRGSAFGRRFDETSVQRASNLAAR